MYWNAPSATVRAPSPRVTVRSAGPAEPGGVLAMRVVGSRTRTSTPGETPTLKVVSASKPVPRTVIRVPPATGPDEGATLVTSRGGRYWNPALSVA